MKLTRPNWSNVRITSQHWHYAALVVLLLLNLTLAVRLIFAWNRAKQGDAARIAESQSQYRAMKLKTTPLRGLDKKIKQAKLDQQSFYGKRFPGNDSEVLTELGALAVKNNVLLARVQYAHGKPQQGLVEMRMEGSLSGDYAPVVRFINGLERDKLFFLIEGVALNGQQSGVVSLRMRMTTYLRADTANPNRALPITSSDTTSTDTSSTEE
jgi:type IV pilus assembly protein PilO